MFENGRRLSDYADLNSENLGSGTPGDLRFDYFDLSSVSSGSVIESRVERVTFGTAPSRARRIVRKDDFLFGTVRPLQKSHAWAPRDCIASTGFTVVRAKRELADSRFIGHFLLSEETTLQASRFAVGSGYPALGEKDLGEFVFPDFTLEEQRRIAEVLDTIDETIQATERVIAKRRVLRAGLAADLLKPPNVVASSEKSNGTMRSPALTSTSRSLAMRDWVARPNSADLDRIKSQVGVAPRAGRSSGGYVEVLAHRVLQGTSTKSVGSVTTCPSHQSVEQAPTASLSRVGDILILQMRPRSCNKHCRYQAYDIGVIALTDCCPFPMATQEQRWLVIGCDLQLQSHHAQSSFRQC